MIQSHSLENGRGHRVSLAQTLDPDGQAVPLPSYTARVLICIAVKFIVTGAAHRATAHLGHPEKQGIWHARQMGGMNSTSASTAPSKDLKKRPASAQELRSWSMSK